MKTAIKVLDIIATIWIGVTIVGLIVYVCVYPTVAELIKQYADANFPEKIAEWFSTEDMRKQIASSIYEILKDAAALVLATVL